MYQEHVPLANPGAIHNGTMGYLQRFVQRGHQLTIDGVPTTVESMYGPFTNPVYQNPDTQVEIAAHTGDPQKDRDLVHIAKRTLWAGKNIWPTQELEDEHLNTAANFLRAEEGYPQEGPTPLSPEQLARITPYQGVGVQKQAAEREIEPGQTPDGVRVKECPGCGANVLTQMDACPHCGVKLPNEHEAMVKEAPGNKHMPGVSDKRNRQYEHIKEQLLESGKSEDEAKEEAARTVNKQRAEHGETKDANTERTPTTVNTLESKAAKWHVVGLGEMQQPSAVEQPGDGNVNPVADGANPDFQMNRLDEASRTQQVAVEGWVNFAVGELTKGMDPEAVKAALAEAGAPANEVPTIMDLATQALAQQQQQEVQTPAAADAAAPQYPSPEDPSQQQSVMGPQQPQVAYAYRIAGTGIRGQIKGRYEDTWGRNIVRFATEDGNLIEVDPSRVEMIQEEAADPVAEIESYINHLPEPGAAHEIGVHAANLKTARLAIHNLISAGNLSEEQVYRLDALDSQVRTKLIGVRQAYLENPWDADYLAAQPKFSIEAAEQGSIGAGAKHGGLDFDGADEAEGLDVEKEIREGAPILVQELHPFARADKESVREAAHAHIWPRTSGLPREEREEITYRFIASALRHVAESPVEDAPETINNDGPAEALFLGAPSV